MEALLGPYETEAVAQAAMHAYLLAETESMIGLDLEAPSDELCIPGFYASIQVMDLSAAEITSLAHR